jgi:hypothetical protein
LTYTLLIDAWSLLISLLLEEFLSEGNEVETSKLVVLWFEVKNDRSHATRLMIK